MYKVGFILNGKSRKKKRFFKELAQARKKIKNLEFNVVETSARGHAKSLASEMLHDGFTHIIAVGGDGTLHEALNGFLKNHKRDSVLGTLPLGTANDFIKSTKGPQNLAELFEAISLDKTKRIDIGSIRHSDGDESFINIADLGIGAEVVKKVNNSSKLLGSGITFFSAIARTFLTYKNQPLTCKSNDWEYSGKVNSLVVANGKYFGNGLCIAPEAELDNKQFSVVVLGDISISDYLKNVRKLKKGEVIDHPQLEYKTAKKLEITSESPCGIEADGEFIGYTPATVSIEPSKINFLIGTKA